MKYWWNDTDVKTNILGKEHVPVPQRPPPIPPVALEWTLVSTVTGQ